MTELINGKEDKNKLPAVFNTPEALKWERKRLQDLCKDDGQYYL